ncbi:hypothetical protein [Paracoccus beibuensis]|uniref:hypothetical protein n=1 Tax=Paracoccus beibuensis TaxID=547602 RepID=UPI00223F2B81|nr:hypothetical protein [Paracoccus beibuensis]
MPRQPLIFLLCVAIASAGVVPWPADAPWPTGAAWADDDDDDDDEGDDGPVAVAPAPLPDFAPDEIVALALDDDDLDSLIAQGFGVIEDVGLPALGTTARKLSIPPGRSLEAARAVPCRAGLTPTSTISTGPSRPSMRPATAPSARPGC